MVQTRLTTALALAFPLLRQVERVGAERTAAETTTFKQGPSAKFAVSD